MFLSERSCLTGKNLSNTTNAKRCDCRMYIRLRGDHFFGFGNLLIHGRASSVATAPGSGYQMTRHRAASKRNTSWSTNLRRKDLRASHQNPPEGTRVTANGRAGLVPFLHDSAVLHLGFSAYRRPRTLTPSQMYDKRSVNRWLIRWVIRGLHALTSAVDMELPRVIHTMTIVAQGSMLPLEFLHYFSSK